MFTPVSYVWTQVWILCVRTMLCARAWLPGFKSRHKALTEQLNPVTLAFLTFVEKVMIVLALRMVTEGR